MHFTATPGIPPSSPALKPRSMRRSSLVEPGAFTSHLRSRLRPLRPVIPNNVRSPRITAAAGTELAGASFCGTVEIPRLFAVKSFAPHDSALQPEGLITHAASLGQGFPHCRSLSTAASRRSLGRISVPVWLTILSDQLPIVALVGRYPTNKLMGRGTILE